MRGRITTGGDGTGGFTLIELLIVVIIIGILVTIAIPKFSAIREKAFIGAMKNDLRSLSIHQQLYYDSDLNFEYATSVSALPGFHLSDGVEISTLTVSGSGNGFLAIASHVATEIQCEIVIGDQPLGSIATSHNQPQCTDPGGGGS